MDEIKKAKIKANVYLLKEIINKWRSISKIEKDFIPSWEILDWPLRFEAFTFIASKDPLRTKELSLTIKEIWNDWIELNRNNLLSNDKCFWPSVDEYIFDEKTVSGNLIENHISMFRVKEVLGIGGFDYYFSEAKNELKEILLADLFYFSRYEHRIIWQIIRSKSLCEDLKECLGVLHLKIKESREVKELLNSKSQNKGISHFLACCLFFLAFNKKNEDSLVIAKRIGSKLIEEQKKNGSFEYDMLTTCLIASSVHYLQIDKSNSVINNALKYFLLKQKKEGNWSFIYSESNTGDILSTVFTLETLDIITNDLPLPIWVKITKPQASNLQEKPSRIKSVPVLNVPKGITWTDISIQFISGEEVEIRAGKPLGVRNFVSLGFDDKRTGNPDLPWEVLRTYAEHQCEISWEDKGIDSKIHRSVKSCNKVIRKRFKYLFGIDDDPLHPYDRKQKAYRTKFQISFRDNNLD